MPSRKKAAAAAPFDGPVPDLDAAHDPGPAAARARAEALAPRDANPIRVPAGGLVSLGTAGWTDPTLTAGGVFYPASATSAEDRLRYYATRFPLVEVDATYYALPARRSAELWAERTPDGFTFNMKAHALMTGQPTEVARLPGELRRALPAELAAKARIYGKDLPAELYDAVWATFIDALEPLHRAGKLGAILLQYPKWFLPNAESDGLIVDAARRLAPYLAAVEFRNRRWLEGARAERTLEFLTRLGLPFVMVDAPPGLDSSLPLTMAVTSPRLAMLRLHGRRTATWETSGATVAQRFRYLYDQTELLPLAEIVRTAARSAELVHAVHNNCYANYATTNALEFGAVLVGG